MPLLLYQRRMVTLCHLLLAVAAVAAAVVVAVVVVIINNDHGICENVEDEVMLKEYASDTLFVFVPAAVDGYVRLPTLHYKDQVNQVI